MAALTPIARGQEVGQGPTVLAYSRQSKTESTSSFLKAPSGTRYRLSLVPELDLGQHVVVLDLVLQKPGRETDDSNLLDVTGRLHGYQPYVFAASDFVRGAQKSVYGESRVINLRKLGMEMHVKIAQVHVEPTPTGSSQGLRYQFNDLSLKITTQNLAQESSGRSNH